MRFLGAPEDAEAERDDYEVTLQAYYQASDQPHPQTQAQVDVVASRAITVFNSLMHPDTKLESEIQNCEHLLLAHGNRTGI